MAENSSLNWWAAHKNNRSALEKHYESIHSFILVCLQQFSSHVTGTATGTMFLA